MYRQTHGRITPTQVADFLILDRDFPRAMHFCLIRAEQSLLAITGGTPNTYRNLAEQRLGRLRAELDYANIKEIIGGGLHEFIDGFQTELNDVGVAIYDTFFAVPGSATTAEHTHSTGSGMMTQSMRSETVRAGRHEPLWLVRGGHK